MKKILLTIVAIFCVGNFMSNAQQRTKLYDGVYIVDYGGGNYSLEDDNTQQCVSISILKEINREKNKREDEVLYKVVCGKWSKRVVKTGIKAAVAYGIAQTGGAATAYVSAAGMAAEWVYEDFCEYLESTL